MTSPLRTSPPSRRSPHRGGVLSRGLVLGTGALALSAASILAACMLGPYHVPAATVWGVLTGSGAVDETSRIVVLDIRLSRAVLAWLAGAVLAVAGAAYQGVLRNPLADPFTLGVSSGGAFGAAIAIHFGLTGSLLAGTGLTVLPLAAFAGSLAALAVVLMLGRLAGPFRRETLVLAGIVVTTFLSACIAFVKSLDEEAVSAIVFWIMGSFQGRGWSHVVLFAPYAAIGTAVVLLLSKELDILALGDTQASQLGVNVGRSRLLLLFGASFAAAAAVAVSGIIGFVGLVVPHLVRLAIGGAHRPLLFVSALVGGLLLLWSDVLARIVLPGGAELPVGVVTALFGGPFFCVLLARRMRRESA
ncbi:iron ABC transporter permease [Oceanidesulfovibrio indonesiensis]|uniref:Iron ABC transporter permease n=1 Tax=Oceanidesulfovibrio indonesiensis TaxID=54767 RepID=A0A7M3MEJ7_9BACT|nr:iron ABC transporter permease [Oceanidesulfovibrio indonesiensis]TVM16878.1 iron ABC transporter permease [Oceanidesulfovibrio indonesiensis]